MRRWEEEEEEDKGSGEMRVILSQDRGRAGTKHGDVMAGGGKVGDWAGWLLGVQGVKGGLREDRADDGSD